jgi:very-short-patch-repair endonuclease
MAQPVKKSGTYQKPRSKTVKKKRKPTTSEIIKKNIVRSKKPHPKYGTSKLEKKFAKEFLEKLGVKYEEQFEAKDIKRFYDFYLPDYRVLLEIDGDFYHGYGKVYEEKSPMQKKNARVDEIKNEWAAMHGIPLIRIWEHDINENPEKVLNMLRERLGVEMEKLIIKENKKKRH